MRSYPSARYGCAIKEPQELRKAPRVSLSTGAAQCLGKYQPTWKAAGCSGVPEQLALSLFSPLSVPLLGPLCVHAPRRAWPGRKWGAVAHHRLPHGCCCLGCRRRSILCKGDRLGAQGSPAALELNPHPSDRSFWRNCALRQLCLLWLLPTSVGGLWVLG